MDKEHLNSMLRLLRPALKNRDMAERILDRYWRDRIALVWSITDVQRAANELDLALTNEIARAVLQKLHYQHNRQLGIRWEDLTSHIEEHVLGRKLTRSEIKQFVKMNILTIDR